MISRSSTLASSTRRTMSTAASGPSNPAPTFPPPIPMTYSWSTPNALRRLSLPPLATAPPIPRSQPIGRMQHVSQGERERPRGGRSLPRAQAQTDPRVASYRPERIIHNPYYNTNANFAPAAVALEPPTFPLPPAPSPSEIAYIALEPLVPVWTESEQARGRAVVAKPLPPANHKEKRLSISGLVSLLRRTSRSRSKSGTREAKRNLLDDE
jgi:hypothetical protein